MSIFFDPRVGMWCVAALIYLLVLTYQDVKNKGWVDDRHNFFMWGLSVGLIPLLGRGLVYSLIVVVVGVLIGFLLLRYAKEYLGEADSATIRWLFTGMMLVSGAYFIVFLMVFFVFTLLWTVLKRYLVGRSAWSPFYPVIAGSFFVSSLLYGG